MTKKLFIFFAFSLFFVRSFSQDATKNFELLLPAFKVHNSLYNKISFLDSRSYKAQIGAISIGLLKNRDAKFVLKEPFENQLTSVLDKLIDSSAIQGELLFQLRRFSYVEPSGARSCNLIADIYAVQNNHYQRLSSLDTVIMVSGPDISAPLIEHGSKIITAFIANSLLLKTNELDFYSLAQIQHIDSIDKKQIPLYSRSKYIDGLYSSYNSFMKQLPDKNAIVELNRDGSVSSVKMIDSTGKKVKIKSKNIYAVISNGNVFIATEYGYYPVLRLTGDEFFFTGDVRIAASKGDVIAGQLALGLVGALAAQSGNRTTFQMIIDYQTGKFIHLRKIEPPAQ